jgi:hypothetical protein
VWGNLTKLKREGGKKGTMTFFCHLERHPGKNANMVSISPLYLDTDLGVLENPCHLPRLTFRLDLIRKGYLMITSSSICCVLHR